MVVFLEVCHSVVCICIEILYPKNQPLQVIFAKSRSKFQRAQMADDGPAYWSVDELTAV